MTPSDQRFLGLLKGLLRPLIRTLIARGVTAPAFYKLIKSVYVEVAHKDFALGAEPPTDSRITLLTGVHRRDVRAILTDDSDAWETRRSKSAMLATVLGQWSARRDYLDAQGGPIALPRVASEGPSFEALVSDINTDIRPRTVLDELLRQNLVVETTEGFLELAADARQGPASDEDKLVFFAANVGDHIAAASENLMSDAPPFFERSVFYNQLSEDAVDAIEANARSLSQDVLEELNTQSEALRTEQQSDAEGTERYRLGIYFYRESAVPLDATPKDQKDEDE
ncbi:MAG: DUF6502 family protein [Pseudomonadota bacterium]